MATLLQNKFAKSNYDILETFEAGLVLHGFEVKSLRQKHGSIKEAYVVIEDDEVYLVKAHIPAYQPNNTPTDYDPYRQRKLLLNATEIDRISKKLHEAGLTIIPISLYNSGRNLKLEIALARGKKKHDKREDMKRKDAQRNIDRAMKDHR